MKKAMMTFLMWLPIVLGLPSAAQAESFFPPKTLADNPKVAALMERWYSEQLKALGEQPLWTITGNEEVYRFTWLRSFHKPMTFRLVVLNDGTGLFEVRRCDGAGGYRPGKIELAKKINIDASKVQKFRDELKDFGFWQQPPEIVDAMMDGAQWLLESRKDGFYHFMDRKSPMSGAYYDAMLGFMNLSGIDLGEVY